MYLKFTSKYFYYSLWVQKRQYLKSICNLFNIYTYFFFLLNILNFFFFNNTHLNSWSIFFCCKVQHIFFEKRKLRKFSLLRSPFIYKLSWDQLEYRVLQLYYTFLFKLHSRYFMLSYFINQLFYIEPSLQQTQLSFRLYFLFRKAAKKG